MTLNVHLLYEPTGDALELLESQLDPAICLTKGEEIPEAAEVHVLVVGRPEPKQISACPQLRALIIPWAGLPEETGQLMRQHPHIAVHNLHHNAVPVAELAFTLLLAAAKFIVPFDQALRRQDWSRRYQPSPAVLLSGKTALILGYGAIGQQVARLCHAFNMSVMATRRSLSQPREEQNGIIYPQRALHQLLPKADALMICLPLTPETSGLVGAQELALLPANAVLVNIGRGTIVQEEALYQALQSGSLHAAGLDVWYTYPEDKDSRSHTPPSNLPFYELENVVMSPHRGGASLETDRLRMQYLAQLLNAAAGGQPMPNELDLDAGY